MIINKLDNVDVNLADGEKLGVTVCGGKDSIFMHVEKKKHIAA